MSDSVRQPGRIRPPLHSDLSDPNSERSDRARFDRWSLGRTALWAVLALAAAGAAVLSIRTEAGSQRVAALLSKPALAPRPPVASIPATTVPVPAPNDRPREAADEQMRQLMEEVRGLAAGQAEFSARLDAIERSLDQTGSIPARPSAAVAPVASPPVGSQAPAKARHTLLPSFGLDLGPVASIESLRFLWATVKAQHGAVVDGLAPRAALEGRPPSSLVMRLVIGPFADRGSAMRACAVIGAHGRPCRPALFEGPPLE